MKLDLEGASPNTLIFAIFSLLEGTFPKAPICSASGDAPSILSDQNHTLRLSTMSANRNIDSGCRC